MDLMVPSKIIWIMHIEEAGKYYIVKIAIGRFVNWRIGKMKRKILFPVKCIAAVLLSPMLLFAVGAMLVMRGEDQLLDR